MDPDRLRPRAVLHVHLHEAALVGLPAVARVEGLGPHSLPQLRDLLARTELTVAPVIDLAEMISVTAYEHPEAVKDRIHLLRPGDQFPHATRTSRSPRSVDIDHPVPFEPDGPPGQTNSHTGQPLSRTPHRAKTHLGYRCTPLPTGEMLWRTPHDLHRIVDAAGTRAIDSAEAAAWSSGDDIDRALARLWHRHLTGQL